MKLPPELMDTIFKVGESNPRNSRAFGKLMSTKTKQKMINCTKVIDTGDLKKVRLLKFQNSKCTKIDLMYALEKGYIDIAKYIQSAYPEASIQYSDIVNSIINNESEYTDKLLQVYKYSNINEYIHLFSLINPANKKMMKVMLDRRPIKGQSITLSTIFDDTINFLIITLDNDYLKNFMNVANNVIVDDQFISKLLLAREFTRLNTIFKYIDKKINRSLKNELLNFAHETLDFEMIRFMEKNKNIF